MKVIKNLNSTTLCLKKKHGAKITREMQKTLAWSLHEKYNRTPFLFNKISLKFNEKLINLCPCGWAVELGMEVETARQRAQ